jgi:type III secretion protein J
VTLKNPLRPLAFCALSAVLLSACQSEIQHGLNEGEANEIVVLLERNHISAYKDKEEGGREITWKIGVPKAHAANAMFLLKENQLPRPKSQGLEIFNRGSLIPTATEERAMFLQALGGELSRNLSSIDGILDARVLVNLPQSDDLSDKTARPEPSASVLIKYRATGEGNKATPPPIKEEDIQRLVAATVQELKRANVAVVMTPASPPSVLENGPQEVEMLGVRMAAESVNNFRLILVLGVVLILLLGGVVVYQFRQTLRGPARSAPRARPES